MTDACLTHEQIAAANLADCRPMYQALQARLRTGDFATGLRSRSRLHSSGDGRSPVAAEALRRRGIEAEVYGVPSGQFRLALASLLDGSYSSEEPDPTPPPVRPLHGRCIPRRSLVPSAQLGRKPTSRYGAGQSSASGRV